MIAGIQNKTYY